MSIRKTILFVVIITVAFTLLVPAHAARVEGDKIIVEEGDYLVEIARQVFGEEEVAKWTILRDANGLVEPYIIYPGQVLKIGGDFKPISSEDSLKIARQTVFEYAAKFFRIRRGRVFSARLTAADAYAETLNVHEMPSYQVTVVTQRLAVKLEWVDILDMLESLEKNVSDYRHVLLMGALIAQESSFRNVPGKNGEIGPCQIKPGTAVYLLPHMPFNTASEAAYILQHPYNNVLIGYSCLLKLGLTNKLNSIKDALEKYNAGQNKVKYAEQVRKRFGRLMAEYNKKAKVFSEGAPSS
jgi:hypothetical protein